MTFSTLAGVLRGAAITCVALALATSPLRAQHPAGHQQDTVKPAPKPPAATQKKKPATKKAAPTKTATTKKATVKKATTSKKGTVKKAATVKAKTAAPQKKSPTAAMPGMTDSAHRAHMADSARRERIADSAHRAHTMDSAARAMPAHTPGAMAHPMPIGGAQAQQGHAGMSMTTSPLGISMERMGSGTTWIPDAVTLPSRHLMMGSWDVMFHAFAFLQWDKQGGARGDDQFGSLNWAMLMASHKLAGGLLQMRTMLSLDPWTVTARGYPLLLQSGEAYKGLPLHDRQHPHDFWMELGALYERPITRSLGLSLYAAPSGEPALGPVAFMHRPSAMDNPAAPLSHHWQDATHVSFGVLTGGLFSRKWKLEGSAFNGREPDDSRWNFDPIRIDSYSGRFTLNPDSAWSFAAGYGYLKSPEALEPDESLRRLLVSALHGRKIGVDGQVASALIYGGNRHGDEEDFSHSLLLETEAVLDRRNTLFGRTEIVQKSAGDLALDQGPVFPTPLPVIAEDEHFNIGHVSLGYIRELWQGRGTTLGLGASGTINFVPAPLEGYYGSRTPLGAFVFLRVRPFYPKAAGMSGAPAQHEH